MLAQLRNQTFFSIHEANIAIAQKLSELNERALSKLEGTQRSLFLQIDRPAFKSLPQQRYETPNGTKPRSFEPFSGKESYLRLSSNLAQYPSVGMDRW